jgi:hypothetical protein
VTAFIAGLLGFFGSMKNWPWKLIGCIALAVAILGGLYFFGRYLYALGASDERAIWEARAAVATEAAEDLGADAGRRHRTRTDSISENLAAGMDQLESASNETAADFLGAWAAADRRLCDAGCSR